MFEMESLIEGYYNSIQKGDPRLKDSFFLHTPTVTISLIAFYLLSIYVLLPLYMKNRKAYSLKTILFYYNIFQIVANSFIVYEILTPLSNPSFDVICEPMNYSLKDKPAKILKIVLHVYLIKAIDLIETCFFVLRKKSNQVSKLHVYHHASTLVVAWFFSKYQASGMFTFNVLLNSSIHVLMYTYYLLSSLENCSPNFYKTLSKWKPMLTTLQMIQFCILITHAMQVFNPRCQIPHQFVYIYFPNIFIVFYMFYQFYQKTYVLKKIPMKHT